MQQDDALRQGHSDVLSGVPASNLEAGERVAYGSDPMQRRFPAWDRTALLKAEGFTESRSAL